REDQQDVEGGRVHQGAHRGRRGARLAGGSDLKRLALRNICCERQPTWERTSASITGRVRDSIGMSMAVPATRRKGLQTMCLQAFMIGAQERTRTSTPLGASN